MYQCFPTLVTAYILDVFLSDILIYCSFLESLTTRVESDGFDNQNVHCWVTSGAGLKSSEDIH